MHNKCRHKNHEDLDYVSFIKDLVDVYGAQVDGIHCGGEYSLIHSFMNIVAKQYEFDSNFELKTLTYCPKMMQKISDDLTRVFDYLVDKGMDVNATFGTKNRTFRNWLEDFDYDTRSPFYRVIYNRLVKYGGRLYI